MHVPNFLSNVWMWELDYKESWAQRDWCFWTVVLEKTPESPLDCREIQPVHPNGNRPEYSLEALMLKLKLQYSGHLMWRADSLEKTFWCWERLKAAGEGDDRGWDGWMASPTRWTWVWANSRSWWWTRRPGMLRFMGSQRVGHDWATELNWIFLRFLSFLQRESCECLNTVTLTPFQPSEGLWRGNQSISYWTSYKGTP